MTCKLKPSYPKPFIKFSFWNSLKPTSLEFLVNFVTPLCHHVHQWCTTWTCRPTALKNLCLIVHEEQIRWFSWAMMERHLTCWGVSVTRLDHVLPPPCSTKHMAIKKVASLQQHDQLIWTPAGISGRAFSSCLVVIVRYNYDELHTHLTA